MGIAGARAEPRFVLLAGIAGLLAGASSMAAGEYVSVQSQRELYEQQIAIEREELEMSPEEEKEELSLIYQAKGIPTHQAEELAERILSNPQTAIDTLAREELGLDPTALGSPLMAAASSFIAFACGAAIPVIPYLITTGNTAFISSAAVCGISLFIVGGLISIFTGRSDRKIPFFDPCLANGADGGIEKVIGVVKRMESEDIPAGDFRGVAYGVPRNARFFGTPTEAKNWPSRERCSDEGK